MIDRPKGENVFLYAVGLAICCSLVILWTAYLVVAVVRQDTEQVAAGLSLLGFSLFCTLVLLFR